MSERSSYPHQLLADLFEKIFTIRLFEAEGIKLYRKGLIRGYFHPYTGEEAIATGVCAALGEQDYIVSTHRGHGHCIARGAKLDLMVAELLGRASGYCRGRGGSMHIADMSEGNMGANGVVGAGTPMSVGAALGVKIRGDDRVAVCFTSDGGVMNGTFGEALNLAGAWNLPFVTIVENNQYAVSTPVEQTTREADLYKRGEGLGIPSFCIDGNDVLEVYETMSDAVTRARAGQGPTLIECKTYRHGGHHVNDPGLYLPEDVLAEYKANDPLVVSRNYLAELGGAGDDEIEAIEAKVTVAMEAAIEFAIASPDPALDEFLSEIESANAAPAADFDEPGSDSERSIMYRDALNEALAEEMRRDNTVFVLGEGIAERGGSYKVTAGLLDEFGAMRVIDTPLAEASFTGAGVGAALTGMRPIVEILFVDFSLLTMDQVINQAAKLRFMTGGQCCIPFIMRTQGGTGNGVAAQHSQSLEALFCHIPGLTVIMPSTPYDAKGLLKSAIRYDNPIIFIEHKLLYMSEGPVPADDYLIPIGVGDVKRPGNDVTLVAWSNMVPRSLEAAEQLAAEGIDVEVIDPRTMAPLDTDLILASVRKTEHVVIVQEAVRRGGVASDIAAIIQAEAFDYLDAPIEIIAGLHTQIPFNLTLEAACVPQVEDIVAGVRRAVYADSGDM